MITMSLNGGPNQRRNHHFYLLGLLFNCLHAGEIGLFLLCMKSVQEGCVFRTQ